MKNNALVLLLALASAPSLALASTDNDSDHPTGLLALPEKEEPRNLWPELPSVFQDERAPHGKGGQVVEEWYTPTLKGSLSVLGRVSWPSSTDVTIDGLWYSDFFDAGWGVTVEADLLSYVAPYWAIGGYVSYNWDRFEGNTIHFPNGDTASPDAMTLNSVFIGGKVLQRLSPWVSWEGRIGLGLVTYSRVEWSGVDAGTPFSNEELFKRITRGAFEIGGRIGMGSPHIQGEFGFGIRIMGGAARGKDVSDAIDPDILTTFMLELGLAIRF